MRRFKDSLVGFKLTSMMSVLHCAFFVAFCMLNKEETDPNCIEWGHSVDYLFWTHFLNTIFLVIQPLLLRFNQISIASTIEYALTAVYQGAIIYTQTWYYYF